MVDTISILRGLKEKVTRPLSLLYLTLLYFHSLIHPFTLLFFRSLTPSYLPLLQPTHSLSHSSLPLTHTPTHPLLPLTPTTPILPTQTHPSFLLFLLVLFWFGLVCFFGLSSLSTRCTTEYASPTLLWSPLPHSLIATSLNAFYRTKVRRRRDICLVLIDLSVSLLQD